MTANYSEDRPMATEQVLDVAVRRHVFSTSKPFSAVMDGIFSGISQPDIGLVFSELAAASSYPEFSSIVKHAAGSAGLMQFLRLDLGEALAADPQAGDQTGHQLVRLIAGNPVTMGEMTRHLADAGSYAPVTVLIEGLPEGGTRIAYDSAASALARYQNAPASAVAERLDAEVLGLLRAVAGTAPPAQ
jgi:hypothetical protein